MKTFIKEEIEAIEKNIELVQSSFCIKEKERFLPLLKQAKEILKSQKEDEITKNNVIAFHLPQIYCAMGF